MEQFCLFEIFICCSASGREAGLQGDSVTCGAGLLFEPVVNGCHLLFLCNSPWNYVRLYWVNERRGEENEMQTACAVARWVVKYNQ